MAVATRVTDLARGAFIGSYAGTTAAQNIHIGFKPAAILAFNRTDGDTAWFWTKALATQAYTIVALTAIQSSTVAGVDNGTVIGFSLPVDAVINENAKTYDFIAWPE